PTAIRRIMVSCTSAVFRTLMAMSGNWCTWTRPRWAAECKHASNNTVNKEDTMNYLCLVYSDENNLHSLPDSPSDPECHAYAQSLQDSGRLIAGQALESVRTATTVRVRGGKTHITDGPFAETKEQLAGFY